MKPSNFPAPTLKVSRRRLPPLNALKAFEAAARYQSFSRAAQELCVTQGAVSRHVAKLEEFLDAKLFDRRPQQMVLTRKGAAYAADLQVLFDEMQEATLKSFGPQSRGEVLRIGVLPTFAIRLLVPRLAHFKQKFPELEIEVDTTRIQPADPNISDVDVAIWWGTGGWSNLVAEPLFNETLIAVGSPDFLAQHRIQSADDIQSLLLLHALHRPDDWSRWLDAAGATRVDGQSGLRLEYAGLVYQGAVDGLGLAIGQPIFIHEDLTHERLVPLLDTQLTTERSYYLVSSEAKSRDPKIIKFTHWLKDEIASIQEEMGALAAGPPPREAARREMAH
jgi:LysR family glycine cleavage system transcriptional activator